MWLHLSKSSVVFVCAFVIMWFSRFPRNVCLWKRTWILFIRTRRRHSWIICHRNEVNRKTTTKTQQMRPRSVNRTKLWMKQLMSFHRWFFTQMHCSVVYMELTLMHTHLSLLGIFLLKRPTNEFYWKYVHDVSTTKSTHFDKNLNEITREEINHMFS